MRRVASSILRAQARNGVRASNFRFAPSALTTEGFKAPDAIARAFGTSAPVAAMGAQELSSLLEERISGHYSALDMAEIGCVNRRSPDADPPPVRSPSTDLEASVREEGKIRPRSSSDRSIDAAPRQHADDAPFPTRLNPPPRPSPPAASYPSATASRACTA